MSHHDTASSQSIEDLSQSYSSESLQPATSSSASPATTHDNNNSKSSEHNVVTLYQPPTPLSLLRSAAINLILPFINGLMLGFGELFAHEIAFRLGWSGTRIFPTRRSASGIARARPMGPGMEIREDASDRSKRDLQDITSLE